ncbi:hypothetical protein CRUP_031688 [Coryphaenoides rupestris]|nr:hypothetical protein CRUP_031688 [Coryphaenoides rupestris]
MHLLSAGGALPLLLMVGVGVVCQVSGLETVFGTYGETLEVPCNNGGAKPEDLRFSKPKRTECTGT